MITYLAFYFVLILICVAFSGNKPNIMPFNYDVMRNFPLDLMYLLPNRLVHVYYLIFVGLLGHCYK